MSVKTFEDLDSWRIGRELTTRIYAITRREPTKRDWGFCDQIQRAAVSIMSNIAEGHERQSPKEFAQYLFISRGSAGEVRSLLYVGFDQGYMSEDELGELMALCIRASRTIWGLIKHIRNS